MFEWPLFRRRLFAVVLPALIAIGGMAAASAQQIQYVERKPGDRCIVCDRELGDSGLVILYRGRRVPVYDREMLQTFLQNPDVYFQKLQSRGALFHEDAVVRNGLEAGWFFFGLWAMTALIAAALAANLALRRGLSSTKWYFLGLAAHFFAVLWLLRIIPQAENALPAGLAKLPSTAPPSTCPKCGASVHPTAERCLSCGASLKPQVEAEVRRVRAKR